jgi:hypothetical protein
MCCGNWPFSGRRKACRRIIELSRRDAGQPASLTLVLKKLQRLITLLLNAYTPGRLRE